MNNIKNSKLDYFPHYFKIFRQVYIKQKLDSIIVYFKAFYWNVHLGAGGTFVGLPKFRKTPGSVIHIGKNVRMLSSFSSNLHGINRKCMISTLTRNAKITIGDNVGLSGVVIASAISIKIGDRVMIGANCTITDTDSHSLNYKHRHPDFFGFDSVDFIEPVGKKEVVIEDDVFICMHSLILKGTFIGKGSVIGAGSIVSGYIPPNVIATGQPAKIIKELKN